MQTSRFEPVQTEDMTLSLRTIELYRVSRRSLDTWLGVRVARMEPSSWCDNELVWAPGGLLVELLTVSAEWISPVGPRGRPAVRSCGSFGG